jgi:hypothetical protein
MSIATTNSTPPPPPSDNKRKREESSTPDGERKELRPYQLLTEQHLDQYGLGDTYPPFRHRIPSCFLDIPTSIGGAVSDD